MGKQHKNYDSFYNKHKDDVVETQVKPNEIVEHTAEEYLPKPETEAVPEPQIVKVEVTGAPRVNLRSKPNKDATVIAVFDSGTILTLMEELPGWYKVTDEKGVGYMMSQYLKKV